MLKPFFRFAVTSLILGQSIVLYSVAPAPKFGTQTPENFYEPSLQLHYYNGFEDPSALIGTEGQLFTYTTDPAKVIDGDRSILLEAPATFVLAPEVCSVEGGETYVVEFDYELADAALGGSQIFVGFNWPGFEFGAVSFTNPGFSAAKGTFRYNLRLPEGQTDIQLQLGAINQNAVVDNLRIYKLVSEVWPVKPNLLRFGFPRLSNYHVYSSTVSAAVNKKPIADIQDYLSRYHLVDGTSIDFTAGAENDYLNMKLRNPDQLLLPYHQTFVSVLHSTDPPVAGSADILKFFNQGLADEWFMKDPEGERLRELIYLDNHQMNHTEHCPVIDGMTFNDYTRQYLQETVYASGYWHGIHFDQSEWYTNPLLSVSDPFHQQPPEDIDIDLDNDGEAETKAELRNAWYSSYLNYFDQLGQLLGPSAMFFGNAGEIPRNEDVLSRVNGLLFEQFSLPGGSSTQLKGVPSDIVLPSVNEFLPIGESDLPHALAWDEIAAVDWFNDWKKLNISSPKEPELKAALAQNSADRQAALKEFAFLKEQIEWRKERYEENAISLNLEQRITGKIEERAYIDTMDEAYEALRETNYAEEEFILKIAEEQDALSKKNLLETEAAEAELATEENAQHIKDGIVAVEADEMKTDETVEEEEDKADFDIYLRESARIMADWIEIEAADKAAVTTVKVTVPAEAL